MRLGVNIDHVATLRNARGGDHPDPLRSAALAQQAGADGITVHLREDRRHIRDGDVYQLKEAIDLPLNLEMAATDEMLAIALRVRPNACCIVPEKREELTTEGGLNVVALQSELTPYIEQLKEASIRVSLFVDPEEEQIQASKTCGADIVELHTGAYCEAEGESREILLRQLQNESRYAHSIGLEVHAGHGLNYGNVVPVAAIPEIKELNIGHFLVGEALFIGLERAIKQMRSLMDEVRG